MNAVTHVAVLADATAFTGPDAELLACIAAAEALDDEANAVANHLPDNERSPEWAKFKELGDKAYDLRVRVLDLPARTPEGLRAKGRLVLSHLEPNGLASEIALSLARDLQEGAPSMNAVSNIALASETTNPAKPDAGLILACTRWLRIQRAFKVYFDTLTDDIANDDPAWAMLDPVPGLVEQIVATRATTPEGFLARARCMAYTYLPTHLICSDDPDTASEDRFQAALYRDLVFMERDGSATATNPTLQSVAYPDAALIAACDQHVVNLTTYNRESYKVSQEAADCLWKPCEKTYNIVDATKPQTMAGLLAKARAIKAEATQPDGTEDAQGNTAAIWGLSLANDLLRLVSAETQA